MGILLLQRSDQLNTFFVEKRKPNHDFSNWAIIKFYEFLLNVAE